MKRCMFLVLIVLLLLSVSWADERGCPARRAADAGHKAIEAFHKVLGPAWHRSWPAKDFDALIAAGPQFTEAFEEIAALEMVFKSDTRAEVFEKNRKVFADAVAEYAAACEAGDKDKVYELMPGLHDAFEMTASAMLPVHYPEFDTFVLTMNLISETHLPSENVEGVTTATDTLVVNSQSLTEESIPLDLADKRREITADLGVIKDLAAKMKECCDKQDMATYRVHLDNLNSRVNAFITKYI